MLLEEVGHDKLLHYTHKTLVCTVVHIQIIKIKFEKVAGSFCARMYELGPNLKIQQAAKTSVLGVCCRSG